MDFKRHWVHVSKLLIVTTINAIDLNRFYVWLKPRDEPIKNDG